jgi:hypothetical protein
VDRPTERDSVVGVAGKPGGHPLWALEERQWPPLRAADGAAVDETAGVDERDVFEDPPRRQDATRDRREAGDGFHALGDPAQAEGVDPARGTGRQRGEHRAHRES